MATDAVGKAVGNSYSASPLDTLCHLRWPLDPEVAASHFSGAAEAYPDRLGYPCLAEVSPSLQMRLRPSWIAYPKSMARPFGVTEVSSHKVAPLPS